MTNLRLSRSNLERAIAAYIAEQKVGTPYAAVPVNVRMGTLSDAGEFNLQNLEELPLPLIAVACPRAERHAMGFPVCTLHVIILGSIDGDSPATDHTNLAGWVAQLLGEDKLEVIRAALNPPADGPDTRAVQDFMLFGMLPVDELSQETDRAYLDDFTYTVHCQPTTDTSL